MTAKLLARWIARHIKPSITPLYSQHQWGTGAHAGTAGPLLTLRSWQRAATCAPKQNHAVLYIDM
eukprot:8319247-Prorocentrum_lima.AAC.1